MRRKTDEMMVRLTVALDTCAARWLTNLRTDTEATSDSEVIRQALMILEELVNEAADQKRFLVRDQDGGEIDLHSRRSAHYESDIKSVSIDRRNILLPERSVMRLNDLKMKKGVSSDSDLIKIALKLYHTVVRDKLEGNQLFFQDIKNNSETCFKIHVSPKRENLKQPKFIFDQLESFALG